MSTKREEKRWKFQILIENVHDAIQNLENERQLIQERYMTGYKELEKLRNYWLGAMGFIISILTPLIAIGFVETSFSFLVIAAIVAGIGIWIGTNMKLQNAYLTFREIDDTYLGAINGQLLPLKGVISTLALIENYSKEQTDVVITYVSIYARSIAYVLTDYMSKRMKGAKLDHDGYRRDYEFAKLIINDLQKPEFTTGVESIEEFIRKFQSNEKKPTSNI